MVHQFNCMKASEGLALLKSEPQDKVRTVSSLCLIRSPSFRWNWPPQRATWIDTCTSTWRCAAWREAWTCRWRPVDGWLKVAGTLPLSALWPAATQGTQTRSRTRFRTRTQRLKSPLVDGCIGGLCPTSPLNAPSCHRGQTCIELHPAREVEQPKSGPVWPIKSSDGRAHRCRPRTGAFILFLLFRKWWSLLHKEKGCK